MQLRQIISILLILFLPALSVAYELGKKVQVMSAGSWHPAYIIGIGSGTYANTYQVHYEGWSELWDEYVNQDRIKLMTQTSAATKQPPPKSKQQATRAIPAEDKHDESAVGHYICQSFEAELLHNQGDFFLYADGNYRDLMYKSNSRWQQGSDGSIIFSTGSQDNKAKVRLTKTTQGKTALHFVWRDGADRWCYRQSR
ncbi:MAG: Tudor-knot domain-containing protein [Thiohalomonadaceae bacterium]